MLKTPQKLRLEQWLQVSPSNRRTKWADIPKHLDLGIPYGFEAVKSALTSLGYGRHIARRRPYRSVEVKQERLNWALERRDWTVQDWMEKAFADEVWVDGGTHCRVFLTTKIGGDEAFDDDKVVEKRVHKNVYWMASGMIHGITKGITYPLPFLSFPFF